MNLLSKVLNISNDPLTWLNYFFISHLYISVRTFLKKTSPTLIFLLFLCLLHFKPCSLLPREES